MIRVRLPAQLQTLAAVSAEVQVEAAEPVTLAGVLTALETAYPMLRGTLRDQATLERRAFIRFFACQQDLSLSAPDTPLPADVLSGREPLLVVGAMAGG